MKYYHKYDISLLDDVLTSSLLKKTHIINLVKSILVSGINLETKSKPEELRFLVDIHRFINNRGKMRSYIEESKIIIETVWFDPMVSVEVENGVMEVIPLTDEGFYDALSEIIHFFCKEEAERKKKILKIDPNEFDWI